MTGHDEIMPADKPAEGWATTPAELLQRSGIYGRAITTEEEWSSVLAGLTRPAGYDGLTPEQVEGFKAVMMVREHDMLAQGHPNARTGTFARPSQLEQLDAPGQAAVIVVAEKARDAWREASGGLSASRIVEAHKFALACIARDARRAAA